MISNALLKLAVGVGIGGAIFYTYKKKQVKKVDIRKKPTMGHRFAPKHSLHQNYFKTLHKPNSRLKRTNALRFNK